ncbi:xanthine dehydrogenase molybdopterin binding subunit [Limibaculum sp. M0105]|uniref:Xanthine dehydrogenase molybdopterin binding subunit n=1 Tax=Thermohalobaculum xanthum TaxID=2753746 RepID=A0A8J7M663_9RHOB|nr:xanthine dehydrogenase molybdopterin binding subunit [Thermohalobaculum xanthum]MBK0398961.1 xanthine dehydrogenase molybdopterin binding subunit [Thermohalobaculum xanthum]
MDAPDHAPPVRDGVHVPRRHDSAEKHVAGRAIYADDAPEPPGLLHGAFGLATIAHGRITALDLDPVRAAPGVVAVLSADDVPGENDTGPVARDEVFLAASEAAQSGDVHFHGQPLFLVAAESREAARRAARLAQVSYAEEPAVLSIAQAMEAGSRFGTPYRMARPDAEGRDAPQAIEGAPMRLSGRVEIGGQEHFYLEGQVAMALPGEDGDLHILSSNQHPSECQLIVAHLLGLSAHAVTVEVRRMGGGFGGKETQGNQTAAAAALIAHCTGRPAKLRLDRDDDIVTTGKRHDFVIDWEAGFDATGRIHGICVTQMARCGWSLDLSNAICDRAMFHADNCYYLPAVEIVSHRLRTNTVSNTAFRGFGGPQGMVGIERAMDEIAFALGLDPLAVRRANFYDPPDAGGGRSTTPYHMEVEDCVIAEIVDDLAARTGYEARRGEIRAANASSPVIKRGIALTPVKFGISFTTSFLNQAGALVHIYRDGSVMLNHGGTEMGQGLFIKVAQVAASELGLDLDRVKITATRTDKVPNTSATAASSGSDMNGMAVRDACAKLKARLRGFAARHWKVAEAEVEFLANRVRVGRKTIAWEALIEAAYLARVSLSATGFYATPKIHWDRDAARGRPFYYFAYGAAVTEAAIDTLTGESRILRVDILHDVGRSLNPAVDLGQIEGGFVQGTGWLTSEELWWDDTGRLRTHAPSTYKIPACSDRPRVLNMALWEKGMNRELTIRRSKAVGEPPLMLAISALHALSDAVAAAGDYRRYPGLEAPATPERILAAVERVRDG